MVGHGEPFALHGDEEVGCLYDRYIWWWREIWQWLTHQVVSQISLHHQRYHICPRSWVTSYIVGLVKIYWKGTDFTSRGWTSATCYPSLRSPFAGHPSLGTQWYWGSDDQSWRWCIVPLNGERKNFRILKTTDELVWPFYGAFCTLDPTGVETDGDAAFLEWGVSREYIDILDVQGSW